MQNQPDDIQPFINAWKKDFGEELTPEQAEAKIDRLCVFFEALAESGIDLRPDAESPA